MKRIVLIITMLILTGALNYVFSQDEKWYKNYFEEHITELDPIEGIYRLFSKRTIYVNGFDVDSDSFIQTVVIKRYTTSEFYIKTISNSNENEGSTKVRLKKVGETNIYEYVCSFYEKEDEFTGIRKSGMLHLNSPFFFDFGYSLPPELIKKMMYNDPNASLFNVYNSFEFIKEYPTKAVYDNVIAKSQPSNWSGSGFAVGNGYLVTNYHVIEDAKTINVKGIRGDFNNGYSAEVIATDKVNDIAILKITDGHFSGFGTIPYTMSSKMADVGESIFVLGYPLTQTMGDEIKLTDGLISSRTGFQGDIANYQMSAPVQPGNSGGPMFDSKGNVIGIVCAHHAGAENASYAIKISYLKLLIESTGLNIALPSNNTISTLSLPEKVKRVKNFVFFIECSQ